MASAGFYLMHRGWQDHPVFRGEEFSKRDAFVWMIEEAAYRERRVAMPQGEVILQRGQFSASIRFMAKAWRWDEKKVRRFLQSCQNAEITAASTAAGQTVITICNYDRYQVGGDDSAAASAAGAPQQRRTTAANEKEGNKGNEGDTSKAVSPRATRLREDWMPDRPYPAAVAALVDLWPPGREHRELDQFRDYWTNRSKDAARLSWDKTWHNRIRDQHDRIMREARNGQVSGYRGPGGNGSHPSGLSTTERAALAFLAEDDHDPRPDAMRQARVRERPDALPDPDRWRRDAEGR